MRKNSWLEQKRQFLSDYFAKKNNGIIKLYIEEFSAPKENNIVSKYHSWTNLIEESRNLNPAIVLSSLDIHPSGFRADNPQAQLVLDTAFLIDFNFGVFPLDNGEMFLSIKRAKMEVSNETNNIF
jgi:hypothetical protein